MKTKTINPLQDDLSKITDTELFAALDADAIDGWSYTMPWLSRHDPDTGSLSQVGKFTRRRDALSVILSDAASVARHQDTSFALHERARKLGEF